jgi:hypothetical protein
VPFCPRFGVIDLTALYQANPIKSRNRQVPTLLLAANGTNTIENRLPALMYSAINGVFFLNIIAVYAENNAKISKALCP